MKLSAKSVIPLSIIDLLQQQQKTTSVIYAWIICRRFVRDTGKNLCTLGNALCVDSFTKKYYRFRVGDIGFVTHSYTICGW